MFITLGDLVLDGKELFLGKGLRNVDIEGRHLSGK